MSQSVQLDMEVLQRIKFLMEYDVMKTSSENILFEQVSMTDTSLRQGKVSPGPAKKPVDFSNLPGMSADPLHPKSAKWGDLPNVTLETVTQDVRKFMSDWTVAAVETMMTYAGVGIPVVLTTNGFWMTLEIIQAAKGKPDWWSLVFSILATLTAGSQAAWLKPLYKLGGKGVGSLFEALDLLYQKAKLYQTGTKTATGVLDDLILLLKDLTPKLPKLLDIVDAGMDWISKYKWGQKVADGTIDVILWLRETIKNIGKWITKTMDAPLYKVARKQGVDRETSKKLGGAVRWGTGIGATGYALTPAPDKEDTPIKGPRLQYPAGSFTTYDSLQYKPK
jgi:hypothetical protein